MTVTDSSVEILGPVIDVHAHAVPSSLSAAHAVDETFPASRALSDQSLATARDQLGDSAFREAWDAGRMADLDELTALADELRLRALG